jgi:hypothetical protein
MLGVLKSVGCWEPHEISENVFRGFTSTKHGIYLVKETLRTITHTSVIFSFCFTVIENQWDTNGPGCCFIHSNLSSQGSPTDSALVQSAAAMQRLLYQHI